jgi:hypothetical protein
VTEKEEEDVIDILVFMPEQTSCTLAEALSISCYKV